MRDYPLLNLFWTILMVFLWVLWFMLLFRVIADIFSDRKLSGGAKAGWAFLVIVLPFLGVFAYLLIRGSEMHEREAARAQRSEEAFRSYVRETATTSGSADDLVKLADLKSRGDITTEEFERAKAKILA